MKRESLKRVVRTFVTATLGLLIPGLLGWLNALTQWAGSEGSTPFPDAYGLAYLAVSAIAGGVIAAVQLVWNFIEDTTGHGFLRDVPKAPSLEERGSVDSGVLLLFAAAAVVGFVFVAVLL